MLKDIRHFGRIRKDCWLVQITDDDFIERLYVEPAANHSVAWMIGLIKCYEEKNLNVVSNIILYFKYTNRKSLNEFIKLYSIIPEFKKYIEKIEKLGVLL